MVLQIVNSKLKASFRRERLHSRPHIVIPTTMIVPGILNGSAGAGYYSKEENQKSVDLWNGMPVVAPDHPTVDGAYTSARSSDILDKFGIGVVLNTKNDDNLTAETWLDEKKTQEVDPRILWRVYNNEPVEVSTGLTAVHNKTPGEFNGVHYDWAALNYRPDHLAILTDTIGACSLTDGCGLLVNKMTFQQIETQLQMMLQEQHKPLGDNEESPHIWIEDVSATEVIYRFGEDLRRQKYTKTRDELSLRGASVNVKLKKSYVVVNDVRSPDSLSTSFSGGNIMDKSALVNSIVNSGCDCWGEDERETLNGFSETHLQRIGNSIEKSAKQDKIVNSLRNGMETDEFKVSFNEDETGILVNTKTETKEEKKEEPVVNTKITMEDLPQELRDQLAYAANAQKKDRDALIDALVANKGDDKETFKNQLEGKSLEDLQLMKDLIPEAAPVMNFQGRSGGKPTQSKQESQFDDSDALTVNAFTFSAGE